MRRFLPLFLLFCSCTSTRYIPVETVCTQWRDRDVTHTVFDTVADTRLVYVKGDTVIDWRDRWHTRTETLHDTVTIERTDSIPYPVEVPARLTPWQQTKQTWGGWAMLAAVAAIIAFVKRI